MNSSCLPHWVRETTSLQSAEFKAHRQECPDCQLRFEQLEPIFAKMEKAPKKVVRFSAEDYLTGRNKWAGLRMLTENLALTLKISKWSRLPLPLRASLEVTGIAALGLIALTSVPKIKSTIEEIRKRNLGQELALIDSFDEPTPDSRPPSAVSSPQDPLASAPVSDTEESGDPTSEEEEFQDDAATPDTSSELDSEPPNGPSTVAQEVWRFHLKTDTPTETSRAVEDLMKKQGAKSTRNPQSAPTGLRVPGGIQFDLVVPASQILQVKEALNSLVETDEQAHASRTSLEARIENGKTHFTWYRSPAKKRVPVGYSRVVIWLSQI